MTIPQIAEDKIREEADLIWFIGQYVRLCDHNGMPRGTCPFHLPPSQHLIVYPNSGWWRCHHCRKQGDIFTFAQEVLNFSREDAIRYIAGISGYQIPDPANDWDYVDSLLDDYIDASTEGARQFALQQLKTRHSLMFPQGG